MKAIKAQVYDTQLIRRLERTLSQSATRAKKKLELTTRNFQQVLPTFLIEEYEQGHDLIMAVGPEDNKSGQIWVYLDQGTDIRYAILSSDWNSKTRPNSFSTSLGSGRVVKIDINFPQPGIEARNWTKLLALVEQEKLETATNKIFNDARLFRN